MIRRALVLAALAAGCGGDEDRPPPPPNPVPTPTAPTIPVQGEKVVVQRVQPHGFEWPGDVVVTAPEPGEVRVLYSLDNPCRHVPRRALSSRRGDTVALVVTWPPVTPDSSRKCPPNVTPYAYRMDLDDVPAGRHTFAMFEAIEGQTAAALSHTKEVTVR